ncbi:hypothetical protein PR202_ga04632 [Eleusine coracana subsp. coracana]|uniref:Inosine/uridine-preferring nucleoside hydrolase domain-containing protein n=1 Tax=Eleusine coracana subsp. coracana TaxID=191504 RepID=A0AAV5BRH3_ELECO|nr:hypothetical protein PR202_ga04632 [Eleusine coracana subsp. coracana]
MISPLYHLCANILYHLKQGNRRYIPLQQPTAQEVMVNTMSAGPTTVILTGAHTNFAIFLMTYPHLKSNVEHIYIMGGGVRSRNPTGCCPENATTSCIPQQCGDHGNLFTSYTTNPNAEFNIFGDPFAAYQVFHSGIPITLVPLDATNTIPINEKFFDEFQNHQSTYEAQYCFKSLKMARDTWFNDQFYTSYFMWDSFTSGVAISSMRSEKNGEFENDFAQFEYMNITDGYTKEVYGPEAVKIRVATKAKPNMDKDSSLDREFFKSFLKVTSWLIRVIARADLQVLNRQENSGRFNIQAQFPFYREVLYKPEFRNKKIGKPIIFDMDMSPGDFVSLIYLLKAPTEVVDLKGILVSGNGWANVASIDIIYDILHMMGRDDIPVGRGILLKILYNMVLLETLVTQNFGSHWLLSSFLSLSILMQSFLCTQSIYVVGGHISDESDSKGNVFTVPSNKYAEFNMYLDPLAAKTVLETTLDITLIPLSSQRKAASFQAILKALKHADHTPESSFVQHLFLLLHDLQQKHELYHHMDMFLGEVLGAVFLVEGFNMRPSLQSKPISIFANSTTSMDGQMVVDKRSANSVKVLVDFSTEEYYNRVANSLCNKEQSAIISSFAEQSAMWKRPPKKYEGSHLCINAAEAHT